ncbi:MAG: class I SAM-dependent methyltransferase [Pseudonocardiales bacterium]|nr:class I SAM-dependent methyltransferase [Pseudonocardiales bacterium]
MKSQQAGAPAEAEAIRRYLDSPDPSNLLSLNFGFTKARVLDAALELGVFTLLSGKSRNAAALAKALDCSRDGIERLLNALVELGLLEETVVGHYAVTPVSETYLVRGSAGYLGQHFAEVMRQWEHWESLVDVVRSGSSQGDLGNLWARGAHPGMFAANFPVAIRLAHQATEQVPVPAGSRVLDFTAGAGEWGIALALHHRDVTVTAHDDPALLNVVRARVEEFGLADRFSFASANFAAPPFPDAHFDMVVFAQASRFIGGEEVGRLVRECARMLRPGGQVLIADVLKNSSGKPAPPRSILDLSLLVNTLRGRLVERSEYLAYLADAGLWPGAEMTSGLVSVITGVKGAETVCDGL